LAEQSSIVVMFRALVMLVCLIAIPLAALFGSSLPEAIHALREGRWPVLSITVPSQPPSTEKKTSEPNGFQPSPPVVPMPSPVAVAAEPQKPGADVLAVAPANPFASSQAVLGPAGEMPSSAVVPAKYEALASAVTPAMPASPPAATADPRKEDASRPVASSGLQEGPAVAKKGGESPALGGQTPAPSAQRSDSFSYVQDRLRQLGATYFLLETMGGQQQLYRFYCRIAVGGNANYTRYFEATDADPLRAMTQVVEQVESWRSGRK
jgi:hypothetical protein